jgi:hypothetical protein
VAGSRSGSGITTQGAVDSFLPLSKAVDHHNPERAMSCPICSGTRISAAYRAESTIYLACEGCRTIWAVEITSSGVSLDSPPNRPPRLDDTLH